MPANWGNNVGWIALASGFFGAAITAILNYIIRAKLATRELKRKEKRIAYVYLVRISQGIAYENVLRQYFSHKVKDKFQTIKKDLKEVSDKLEVSHALIPVIAKIINTDPEIIANIKRYSSMLENMEKYFDQFFAFKIPDELLGQFPNGCFGSKLETQT
jgi:hypothetical protein